mmetsp:Transcript_9998/g.26657  ORF Transcript_9998/g.26657 Transcript_9998/m.26657 type:complete len:202 (+) Transcript_9998:983-1588(+)
MEKIVRKPAALLPKQGEHGGCDHLHGQRVREQSEPHRKRKQRDVGRYFVRVKRHACVERFKARELGAHLANICDVFFRAKAVVRLRGEGLRLQHTDKELGESFGVGAGGVKRGKDICGVLTRGSENDFAAGMSMLEARDVIHAAVDCDPRRLARSVGGKLFPRHHARRRSIRLRNGIPQRRVVHRRPSRLRIRGHASLPDC